jgi:hypothetical protein
VGEGETLCVKPPPTLRLSVTFGSDSDDVGGFQQVQAFIAKTPHPAQLPAAGHPGLRAGARLAARSRCGGTRPAASRSLSGKPGIRHHPHRRPARCSPPLFVFGVPGVGEVDSRHDQLATGLVLVTSKWTEELIMI